ncbi:hypothetical protein [Flavilitoribacter nigricans]|uniref:Uncharacterized protein n=1 Tax=Flavilitoribacter nigricans (strain ATCC 23147 / DSM 23189 / NBRC 102662 / NCIMB 1420 / SS-2) TaxID=1122177 RepID=A0A2D0MWW2_FLAN2|nr:hypothetical protein [Flavilitoribacter nigricans]PHN00616.1 hypothetical protein CRP01_41285 [Flavilitoribacter nigricans DSM 23189 = NBRC 102662]
MKQNTYKILEIIQALDEETLKQARLYLLSPLHCTNESLLRLFDHLVKQKEKGWVFQKEKAYRAVETEKKYTNKAISRLMSLLTKELEAFLAWRTYRTDKYAQEFYRLHAWQEFRLDKFFFQNTRQLQQQIDEGDQGALFYEKFLLAKALFFHPATDKYDIRRAQYLQMMRFIERDTVLKTLKFGGEWLLYKRVIQVENVPPLLISLIREFAFIDEPDFSIRFFAGILQLYEQNSPPAHFTELFALLQQHWGILSWEEAALAVKLLINFAGPKAEQGQDFYLDQLFALIKWALETELFLEKGRITEVRFTNVVAIAAKLKAFGWAQSFVAQYKYHLVLEEKEDIEGVLALNQAYILYHEGFVKLPDTALLEEAYRLLANTPKSTDVTNLRIYSLSVRVLFDLLLFSETEFFIEQFFAVIKNFRSFLGRQKKISRIKKTAYREFLDYMVQFGRFCLRPDATPERILQYRREIASKEFFLKDWLLTRLEHIAQQKYRR